MGSGKGEHVCPIWVRECVRFKIKENFDMSDHIYWHTNAKILSWLLGMVYSDKIRTSYKLQQNCMDHRSQVTNPWKFRGRPKTINRRVDICKKVMGSGVITYVGFVHWRGYSRTPCMNRKTQPLQTSRKCDKWQSKSVTSIKVGLGLQVKLISAPCRRVSKCHISNCWPVPQVM